jgi:hypothetical protein
MLQMHETWHDPPPEIHRKLVRNVKRTSRAAAARMAACHAGSTQEHRTLTEPWESTAAKDIYFKKKKSINIPGRYYEISLSTMNRSASSD